MIFFFLLFMKIKLLFNFNNPAGDARKTSNKIPGEKEQ